MTVKNIVTIAGAEFDKYPEEDYMVREIWYCGDYKGCSLELDRDKATGRHGFTVFFRSGTYYDGGCAASLTDAANQAMASADEMIGGLFP